MLVGHTLAGNLAVVTFFFFCQLVMLAALDGMLGIGVNFLDSQVSGVDLRLGFLAHVDFGSLEQREIVGFSVGARGANDTARLSVDHDLRLLRVTFFLAGVVFTLFFWDVRQGFRSRRRAQRQTDRFQAVPFCPAARRFHP